MLSYQDIETINRIVQEENAEEIVLELIKKFASKSVDNCRVLIRTNNFIEDEIMKLKEKSRCEALEAAHMAVIQKYFDKKDYSAYLASMIPVCKILFPFGNSEGQSQVLKEYFAEFIKLLHNKKAFDMEKDRSWAENYGYLDYITLVLENEKNVEDK